MANIFPYRSSGRARCQLCNKVINKGELSLKYEGYQASWQVHFDTKICLKDQFVRKMIGKANERRTYES